MITVSTFPQVIDAAAPRGGGFLCCVTGFRGFPRFDFGQLPTGAAGCKGDRLREGRICFGPAPGRRAMDAVAGGKLYLKGKSGS